MVIEKQEKKKRRILKQIFKCLGLGLLAILLLLAIVFQAPWKVITLLFIVLAACTILPRQMRKWFWLSAAAIVVILIIWVFLPSDDEGWRRYEYNFDKELAAMESGRGIPDEQNAAMIYSKLLESYDANEFNAIFMDYDVFDSLRSGPWSSYDHPEVAEWLKGQKGAIEKLLEASKLEVCRFPIPNPINGRQSDRNAAIRRWADLLVIAANNDIGEGRINKALQKNVALLQMANHLCQQPTTIDLLVGIAVESLAIRQFNRFVVTDKAAETHISFIEKALQDVKHDWCSDLTRILEYDKLCTKAQFANYYEINPKGHIRLSRDPLKEMRATLREVMQNWEFDNDQLKASYERIAYPSYLGEKLIKTYTVMRWFYVPSNPQKAAKVVDSAHERYYAMTYPDFDWQKEPRELPITSLFSISVRINYARLIERLAGMSEKIYYDLHYLYLRQIAENRGSQIIIALRRYKNKTGNWPESIDDVKPLAPAEIFVDPINGSSFVYKLTEENFTLYSKGKNNIDEGGKRDRWDEEKTGADDWLIWPLKLPKTNEEKANVESG